MNKKRTVYCVVPARTGSSRLPGKVLKPLAGKPSLLRQIDRLLQAKTIDKIIVATTTEKRDDAIVDLVKDYHPKVSAARGSEIDVTDRFYQALLEYKPDVVLRITGDCPLIDPEVVDLVVNEYLRFNGDYVANTLKERTYPRGLDTEAFSFEILEKLWKDLKTEEEREHVTLFIRRNTDLFKCKNIKNPVDYSFHRWTLDEPGDYTLLNTIFEELQDKNPQFRMKDVIELFEKRPELIKINQDVEQKNPHY